MSFFLDFTRISESWENCKKRTDEFRGFLGAGVSQSSFFADFYF